MPLTPRSSDGVDALVLRVRTRGVTTAPAGDAIRVMAAAGEPSAWRRGLKPQKPGG